MLVPRVMAHVFDYDAVDDDVYFMDASLHVLTKASMSGERREKIPGRHPQKIDGIAVDWVTRCVALVNDEPFFLNCHPSPGVFGNPGGRCTKGRIGPTWDRPKLRHFRWLLNRLLTLRYLGFRSNCSQRVHGITGK